MKIVAGNINFKELNEEVRQCNDKEIIIDNCNGQRYIGAGSSGKQIIINGTPGNALGAYLDGSDIEVFGNGQDAMGDTMNEGSIIVHGSVGDACGYAMRGGIILIEGNTGYRTGIHMKQYYDKKPIVVIGNEAGSFLGEYQAGGVIVVLGLDSDKKTPVGRFCSTGMHGGKVFLRCEEPPVDLPLQVTAKVADEDELKEIVPYIEQFCSVFNKDKDGILSGKFYLLSPDTKNPYHRLYTIN